MVVSRQQYLELEVKMEELTDLVHMVISHLQLSWEVVFPPPPLTSESKNTGKLIFFQVFEDSFVKQMDMEMESPIRNLEVFKLSER